MLCPPFYDTYKMRQRRKCLYRNCGHNQGENTHNCKFHTFPKDSVLAQTWLNLSGVYDKTPQELVPHWCICSCHFPGGRSKENPFPEEFMEIVDDPSEDIVQSPPSKTRKVHLQADTTYRDLTPSLKLAAEALLSLTTATGAQAETPPHSKRTTTPEEL